MTKRAAELMRFYRILDDLAALTGGPFRLGADNAARSWPGRGVLFFYEAGEERTESGQGRRIVRVATHALKPELNTTLADRLASDGAGAHRTSPFRTMIGLALQDLTGSREPANWGRDKGEDGSEPGRAEQALEAAVSVYVGQMPFLYLAVDDAPGPRSERAFIERNAIALLSNYARPALDAPSQGWLGRRCGREKVRQSGLWNMQHVDAGYDPSFMDSMKTWMEDMRRG